MVFPFGSLAARREDDRVVIEPAVDNVPGAGDERQMGEAVGRRLRSDASQQPGAEDPRQNRRISRLFEE